MKCVIILTALLACTLGDSMNHIHGRLWVGTQDAAYDLASLRANGINAILNVAWDLDIRYPAEQYRDNANNLFTSYLNGIQYAKVGLVDGTGNNVSTLAAAVLTLTQYLTPRVLTPADAYSQPVTGVLVHCHLGQSRSVTTAAVYLWFTAREELGFKSYADAVSFVKAKRKVSGAEYPKLDMTSLALELTRFPLMEMFLTPPTAPAPCPPCVVVSPPVVVKAPVPSKEEVKDMPAAVERGSASTIGRTSDGDKLPDVGPNGVLLILVGVVAREVLNFFVVGVKYNWMRFGGGSGSESASMPVTTRRAWVGDDAGKSI